MDANSQNIQNNHNTPPTQPQSQDNDEINNDNFNIEQQQQQIQQNQQNYQFQQQNQQHQIQNDSIILNLVSNFLTSVYIPLPTQLLSNQYQEFFIEKIVDIWIQFKNPTMQQQQYNQSDLQNKTEKTSLYESIKRISIIYPDVFNGLINKRFINEIESIGLKIKNNAIQSNIKQNKNNNNNNNNNGTNVYSNDNSPILSSSTTSSPYINSKTNDVDTNEFIYYANRLQSIYNLLLDQYQQFGVFNPIINNSFNNNNNNSNNYHGSANNNNNTYYNNNNNGNNYQNSIDSNNNNQSSVKVPRAKIKKVKQEFDDVIDYKDISNQPYTEICKVAKSMGIKRCKKEDLLLKIKEHIKNIKNNKNNNDGGNNIKSNNSKPIKPINNSNINSNNNNNNNYFKNEKQYKQPEITHLKRNNINTIKGLLNDNTSTKSPPFTSSLSSKKLIESIPNKEITRCETLWWMIFKNQHLKNKILNGIKNGICHKYHELFKVDWLLKNNHLELVLDKVSSNQYLVFHRFNSFGDAFSTIFQHIKPSFNSSSILNNERVLQFYRQLFKNYSKYFVNANQKGFFALQNKNILAAQILFEEYNFNPSISLFNYFLKQSSFKVFQFVLSCFLNKFPQQQWSTTSSTHSTNSNGDQIQLLFDENDIWVHLFDENDSNINESYSNNLNNENNNNNHSNGDDDEGSILISKYLSSISLINNNSTKSGSFMKKRFKIINYLISTLGLKSPKLKEQQIRNLYGLCPLEEKFKLKHLIQACLSIIYFNFKLNDDDHVEEGSPLLNSEELEEIIGQFNQDQLKICISDFFKYENENGLVKKLILMYYSITQNKIKPIRYYVHFEPENDEYLEDFDYDTVGLDILALEYGNFELLKYYFKTNNSNNSIAIENYVYYDDFIDNKKSIFIIKEQDKDQDNVMVQDNQVNAITNGIGNFIGNPKYQLFKYCLLKSKQLSFIQKCIDEIKQPNILDTKRISPQSLFSLVIGFDYIPYIQLVAKSVGNMMKSLVHLFNYNNYVKSIKSLEYVFSVSHGTINATNLFNWIQFGHVGLLNKLESLLPSNQLIEITNSKYGSYTDSISNDNKFSTTLKYIITLQQQGNTNADKYIIDSFLFNNIVKDIRSRPQINLKTQQQLLDIQLFIQHTTYDYNIFNPGDSEITLNQIKLFNWIFLNRYQDLVDGGRCKISKTQTIQYLYLSGNSQNIWNYCTIRTPMDNNGLITSKFSSDIFFRESDLLLKTIASKSDIITTSFIFKNLFGNNNNIIPTKDELDGIKSFLLSAASEGSMLIFEYLFHYHYQVLEKRTSKKNDSKIQSWYLISDMKSIIFKILSSDHLELACLFLEKFEITSKQFYNHCSNTNSSIYSFLKNKYYSE